MEKEGLSVEFGDVAWKISSDFKRRLMIDDLSGLSREVTALHHLCHRYLFPKGFIKKKEREKAASQRFQRRASHKSRSIRETEVASIEARRAVLYMSVRMPGHVNKAKH